MIRLLFYQKTFFSYLLVFILTTQGTYAMAASHKGKDCLFSAISGTITLNGEPAAGAHVKRIAGKAHVEGEFTDENGYFAMPAIWERNLLSRVFPMEFVVPQKITVTYIENDYDIWIGIKRHREENSEALGKPLVVTCELLQDSRSIMVKGALYDTKCVWDVEEDPDIDYSNPANVYNDPAN